MGSRSNHRSTSGSEARAPWRGNSRTAAMGDLAPGWLCGLADCWNISFIVRTSRVDVDGWPNDWATTSLSGARSAWKPTRPVTRRSSSAIGRHTVPCRVWPRRTTDAGSALDGRITCHEGNRTNEVIRKRIEEHFGCGKTIGRLHKTVFQGLRRVGQHFMQMMTASNLVRMSRMLRAGRWRVAG